MEKSVSCVIAFLGIVYSGNFYCPLDVKSPLERISKIIEVLQPAVVVFDSSSPYRLKASCTAIDLNGIENQSFSEDEVDYYKNVLDIDPLYVMFTSGSTGLPKGVVISHKAVIDYIKWQCAEFQFDETVVLGNQAPFYFDASLPDIYTPLATGAALVLIPEFLFVFPNRLIKYLNKYRVNTLIWVPSALVAMTSKDYFSAELINDLRLVMFCGEVMPTKHLNIWRKFYPNANFVNLYGPTETTYACTYYKVDREFEDDQLLPIGRACENTEILVLDDCGQLVQGGEIGELYVRGTCLSSGYYGNYEKTAASFVQNPLNKKYVELVYRTGDLVKYNEFGEIVYIGRKDFQIKHQGYRIELGEIEAAAYGIPQMRQCCAVHDAPHNKIMLFCVLSSPISEKEIYSFLKSKLPKYMLPREILLKETLPLNSNGKIDRLTLKQEGEGKG